MQSVSNCIDSHRGEMNATIQVRRWKILVALGIQLKKVTGRQKFQIFPSFCKYVDRVVAHSWLASLFSGRSASGRYARPSEEMHAPHWFIYCRTLGLAARGSYSENFNCLDKSGNATRARARAKRMITLATLIERSVSSLPHGRCILRDCFAIRFAFVNF